jgi:hypothetical protein
MPNELCGRKTMGWTVWRVYMLPTVPNKKSLVARLVMCGALFALISLVMSCSGPEKPVVEKAVQRTFASPSEAGDIR